MMKKRAITVVLLLVLVAIAIWLTTNNSNSTLQVEQTDFAIKDTATVNRIILTNQDGGAITLERVTKGTNYNGTEIDFNGWMLNGKYRARQDAVDLLMKTFRRIQVKSAVPKSATESINAQIGANHIRVDIFQGGEEPAKSWYVGGPTQDHYGTYMVLKTPEHGMSAVPHIMHLPGFYGFLTARFFMNETDWRWTGVFNYHPSEIAEISVAYGETPTESFKIQYTEDEKIYLLNGGGIAYESFDTIAVKNYILQFKKVHFEKFDSTGTDDHVYLDYQEQDSLLNGTTPYCTISVTNKQGKVNEINIWKKEALPGTTNAAGDILDIDPERKNAYFQGEWLIVQNFVFDHLFVPLSLLSGNTAIMPPTIAPPNPIEEEPKPQQ